MVLMMVRLSASFRIFLAVTATVILFLTISLNRIHAAPLVDVALVIAIDVSASVDNYEHNLMRKGLAKAISSPQVLKAITKGRSGSIAVNVMQWSGFDEQIIKIDWTKLETSKDLSMIAEEIRSLTRRYDSGATDIGSAIEFSRKLLLETPFQASRQVIDIAGDGPNNVNNSPHFERDITTDQGITINGLAIVGEAAVLPDYYFNFVVGGKGAFVETAKDFDSFEKAMQKKLVREIEDLFLF